jgi:hypothetical protein
MPHYRATPKLTLMLRFERDVVSTLTAGIDEPLRTDVQTYVDGALRAMPEHLRAGMIAESLALGAWARLSGQRRGFSLERLESSKLDPVRQYVRLLRSLVLFAEHELPAGRAPSKLVPE